MAIYPGASVRLLTVNKNRKPLTEYNRVNFHVAVSESSSLYGMFNQSGAADSHFYVRRDGSVEQYVDTAWRANADYEGNDATISIETQGGVNSPDTEPWDPAQLETLAQIYAWATTTHGIACQVASSSHYDTTSRGMSWHRLGIDGNFPPLPDIRAGREQRGGGMHWSTSRGKACPGGGKIQQIPGIFDRAMQILGGDPQPRPEPEPEPEPLELIDMQPFIAYKTTADLYYYVSPASPKPIAVAIAGGGMTPSLRKLEQIEFGDSWDAFLKTVQLA